MSDSSPVASSLAPAVLDAVGDVVVVFGEDGRLRHWNRATTETTGHDEETLTAEGERRLFGDADTVREAVEETFDTGSTTFDATLRTAAGDARRYGFEATAIGGVDRDGDVGPDADTDDVDANADSGAEDRYVVCVGRDVTDARRRERELERHGVVLDALADAVYAVESDGTIAYVNDRYVRMKGVPREELLGTDIDDWVTDTTVERADEMRERLARDEYDVATVEYEFVTADGTRFPAELRVRLVADEDGGLHRVGTIRDVTDRAARERTLRRQNERLDEFAAIVSHDLRNPLNVAQGRLELARMECESDHFDDIGTAHDRMRTLIDDLLTLSRQGRIETEPTAVSLDRLARSCWAAVAEPEATLSVETDATVRADERQLRRLLENLFRNSVEHGSTGDRAAPQSGDSAGHGSTGSRPRPDDGADHGSPDVRPGADDGVGRDEPAVTVRLRRLADGFAVVDDGPGVPPDERDRVFEARYSTTPGGTGLGLRIVRQVAEAHGWSVRLTDGPDGGAQFEVHGVTFLERGDVE